MVIGLYITYIFSYIYIKNSFTVGHNFTNVGTNSNCCSTYFDFYLASFDQRWAFSDQQIKKVSDQLFCSVETYNNDSLYKKGKRCV